jgi:hypothetical protein
MAERKNEPWVLTLSSEDTCALQVLIQSWHSTTLAPVFPFQAYGPFVWVTEGELWEWRQSSGEFTGPTWSTFHCQPQSAKIPTVVTLVGAAWRLSSPPWEQHESSHAHSPVFWLPAPFFHFSRESLGHKPSVPGYG